MAVNPLKRVEATMSNPVQLCFHNSIPDKYLRSQNQCQGTADFPDLCSILYFPRRATVLITLRTPKNTKVLPRQPTASKKNQTKKKTTAPFRVSSNMWRVAPHLSPMFSRVYQPRRSIAPWIRGVASEIAASETTSSLLSQIQGDGNDGKVQSCTGGLLRLQLGPSFFLKDLLLCFFFGGEGGLVPPGCRFFFLVLCLAFVICFCFSLDMF